MIKETEGDDDKDDMGMGGWTSAKIKFSKEQCKQLEDMKRPKSTNELPLDPSFRGRRDTYGIARDK